jgi:alkaline phosphatase D
MLDTDPTTRREFLVTATALGCALALGTGCTPRPAAIAWREQRDAYPQGVASGDPAPDSVILWTRRAPATPESVHTLQVDVASDPDFAHIVANGVTEVRADSDWTCRFLAIGLEPRREYWYRFTDETGAGSRIGRTLTAPAADDEHAARFAFVSCQDPTQGGLNAWRKMIHEDTARAPDERLGFVLHLGDFIYEIVWYPEDRPQGMYARRIRDLIRYPQGEKVRDFHVPATLADYRTAYRVYLQDPELQDARARWPFVPVWDNHEFSWQGWQSQQVFGTETRPAQTKKIVANQAWFEYQPARVSMPNQSTLARFAAPTVVDAPIETFDALGLGTEPNNLLAVQSLRIHRTLRWGKHIDLIITDNHSFRAPPVDPSAFSPEGFRWMQPQEIIETLDGGRAFNGAAPPATVRYADVDVPNPRIDSPQQSYLGAAQKEWFVEQLRAATATWKLWGHSFGTLTWRTDMHNLPAGVGPAWPGASYALLNGGHFIDNAEIFDLVKNEGIANFAIVAGDKHSFWAGTLSKQLPPGTFEPVGVEFVTGSISSPGLFEVAEFAIAKDNPLRALYLHDAPDGRVQPAINMTVLHGVQSSLTLQKTGDIEQALAVSNPDVSPHLAFADFGGHGFATVRASAAQLETEFVCIPRPIERIDAPDGGPVAYRVVHRVKTWRAGDRPTIDQQIIEGKPPFTI